MTEYDPTKFHFPHWLNQPNNQKSYIRDNGLSDKLKDGHQYQTALIDKNTGEKIDVFEHGTFRRFDYEDYTDEAVRQFKAFARQYEKEKTNAKDDLR